MVEVKVGVAMVAVVRVVDLVEGGSVEAGSVEVGLVEVGLAVEGWAAGWGSGR